MKSHLVCLCFISVRTMPGILGAGYTVTMKYFMAFLLSFLLVYSSAEPVFAQNISMQKSFQSQSAPTESDYWLNATYAMGGSAAGNGLIVLTVLVLDLLPLLLTTEGEPPPDFLGAAGSWLFLLGLMPVVLTSLSMHMYSPKADWNSVLWTSLGSLVAVLLHSLLVVLPLSMLFQQEKATETFYLVAPIALLTGVLFEGLSAAQFHQFSERWQISQTPRGGLMLSHHIDF